MGALDEGRGPGESVSKRSNRHGCLLLLGMLVLGAVVFALVFKFTKPKVMYSRSVSELLRGTLRDTPARVQGTLVRGSLCKVEGKCEFRFRLTDEPWRAPGSRSELDVRYGQCVIPDTFRDAPGFNVEITAEGELCSGCAHFEATLIMAKCPSKYEIPDGGYPRAGPVRSCGAVR